MFYRYRHKFSNGVSDWEYIESCDDSSEVAAMLHEEYDWAEHYRGLDIEAIDRPPDEWLKEQAEEARESVKWKLETAERYEKMLARVKKDA